MNTLRATLRRTFQRRRSIDWFGLSLVVLLLLAFSGLAQVHSAPLPQPVPERSPR